MFRTYSLSWSVEVALVRRCLSVVRHRLPVGGGQGAIGKACRRPRDRRGEKPVRG